VQRHGMAVYTAPFQEAAGDASHPNLCHDDETNTPRSVMLRTATSTRSHPRRTETSCSTS
jgi:hypothetical protein